jgi:hypothetical protein
VICQIIEMNYNYLNNQRRLIASIIIFSFVFSAF